MFYFDFIFIFFYIWFIFPFFLMSQRDLLSEKYNFLEEREAAGEAVHQVEVEQEVAALRLTPFVFVGRERRMVYFVLTGRKKMSKTLANAS